MALGCASAAVSSFLGLAVYRSERWDGIRGAERVASKEAEGERKKGWLARKMVMVRMGRILSSRPSNKARVCCRAVHGCMGSLSTTQLPTDTRKWAGQAKLCAAHPRAVEANERVVRRMHSWGTSHERVQRNGEGVGTRSSAQHLSMSLELSIHLRVTCSPGTNSRINSLVVPRGLPSSRLSTWPTNTSTTLTSPTLDPWTTGTKPCPCAS